MIELLAAISIIAVLAALLFPAVAGVKRSGLETKCLSNLRQIAAAMNLHANDNEGLYPYYFGDPAPAGGWSTWISRVQPYLESKGNAGRESAADIMSCPAKINLASDNVATYGINSFIGIGFGGWVASDNWCYLRSRVPQLSRTILVGDMQAGNIDYLPTSDGKSLFGDQGYGPGFRHGKKSTSTVDRHALANVAFCDGHVESLTPDQLLLDPPDLASKPVGEKSRWKWW